MPRQRLIVRSEKEIVEDAKKHGHTLDLASDVEELYTVTFLPTGIPQVDDILGGGFPRGHITEVFGPWSAGKTWLVLNAIARTQKDGGIAAFIDSEISYSPQFSRALGVDTERLLLSTPETGEEALELIVELIKKRVDIIFLDSVTSLVPGVILKKEIEIGSYSPEVRLWNAGLKRIKPALKNAGNTVLVFSNQVRDNVGVFYGPATTEPMGHRSKHESVLRLEIRRQQWIKKSDKKVGQVSLVRVAKCKYDGGHPFMETTVDIHFVDTNDESRVV